MKKWYANVYILLTILISLTAIATSSLLFLLIPQSSEIMRLMQWRMMNARAFAMQGEVRYKGTASVKNAQNVIETHAEEFVFSSEGLHDVFDQKSPKMQQAFSLAIGATDPLTFIGNYSSISDARFFKFTVLPTRIGSLHFDTLKNRWLRVDLGMLFKDTTLPIVGGGYPPISDEDHLYLREQFRITPFFNLRQKLRSEKLDGVSTYHYQVEPVTLFFKDYFVLAETKRLGRELTNKERDVVDIFFSNITPDASGSELWIGTHDYYLYRIRARALYDDGVGRKGVITFTANFSHFNEPVVLDTPTSDVEDITPLLVSLLPGLSGHLPLAKNGSVPREMRSAGGGLHVDVQQPGDIDADHDGLTTSLESFYGIDPNNPDTDGDGVKDGDEVSAGCNPLGTGALFGFGLSGGSTKCK